LARRGRPDPRQERRGRERDLRGHRPGPPRPPMVGAQTRRPGPPAPPSADWRDRLPDPKAVFSRLDRDKNNQLNLQEFAAGMRMFHHLHGPAASGRQFSGPRPWMLMAMRGRVGRDVRGWPGPPWSRSPARTSAVMRRFKAADRNDDGKLSKDEAPEFLRNHFDRMDSDKDGQLSPSELSRAAAAARRSR
jgi:Ca2+-binding EF-hand superfamily protein